MSDVSDQRRYYERMMDEIATEHRQQIDQLEAENDKLRELLRDMWLQLLNAYDRKEVDEFADRMRELSMEVDG